MSGEFDITRAQELSQIEDRLVEPDCVVLDLSNVKYIDTTFLRFLINLKRHANKVDRSAVKIVGANAHIQRVLTVTGLSMLFVIEAA